MGGLGISSRPTFFGARAPRRILEILMIQKRERVALSLVLDSPVTQAVVFGRTMRVLRGSLAKPLAALPRLKLSRMMVSLPGRSLRFCCLNSSNQGTGRNSEKGRGPLPLR